MDPFVAIKLYIDIAIVLSIKNHGHIGQECGVEASLHPLHKDPWLVLLEYYRRGQLTEIRCGGTLIDTTGVVTAAHCIRTAKFNYIMVRLGEYNTETADDFVEGVHADPIQRIQVADVVVHPQYDGQGHDIAILKLKTAAPFTDFIRPICLPGGNFTKNVTLYASGWGEIPNIGMFSDVKKIIPLPYIPTDDCKKAYVSKLPDHIICAGGEEGVDTCKGDSGGPLILNRRRVELRGITSLGYHRCGEKGRPSIYTDVSHYLGWIKEVIKKWRNWHL